MTDKLICPFCNAASILDEPVCGYPDGPRMLMCYNTDCPTTGRWLPEQIWRQIIVLQKKLDKATAALNELKDGNVQGSSDSVKMWAQVIAEAAIKEIEGIKE